MSRYRDPLVPPTLRDGTPLPRRGWVSGAAAESHPGLALHELTVELPADRRTPHGAKDRLGRLSSAVNGFDVLHMHEQETPAAYRALYVRLGRDPNEDRPPQEAAYYRRLADGGFPTVGLPDDLLLIALAETGVPVWAVDADYVEGPLGLRIAVETELPEPDGVSRGTARSALVVADNAGAVAEVGRTPLPGRAVGKRTSRATLFSVQVAGVTDMRVHEAFWLCTSMLASDARDRVPKPGA